MSTRNEVEDAKDKVVFAENAIPQIDQDFVKRQARVVRKLDLFLAPILMVLQLISFLDRGNIGYAATQGMPADLHLQGTELNVCTDLEIH